VIDSDTALQVKEGYNLALMSGCASGAAVTPANGSVPAGVRAPVRTWVSRLCACVLGVCACVVVCVLGMARFETTRVASSAWSPVSVGAQKSYMTPQCSRCFKKNH